MNEKIDANVETTFKVKFDHVAMDNFHAVLSRIWEPGRSVFEWCPGYNHWLLPFQANNKAAWLSTSVHAFMT